VHSTWLYLQDAESQSEQSSEESSLSSSEASSVSDTDALNNHSLSVAQENGSVNLGSMNNKLVVSSLSSHADSQIDSLSPPEGAPKPDNVTADGKGAYIPLVNVSEGANTNNSTESSPTRSVGTDEVVLIDEKKSNQSLVV